MWSAVRKGDGVIRRKMGIHFFGMGAFDRKGDFQNLWQEGKSRITVGNPGEIAELSSNYASSF